MPEEVQAERLYVEIVADASGFRRDLKAKTEAAAQGVRVKIQADLDSRRLEAQVKAAARAASNRASVKVNAEFNARQVRASLSKALREGAKAAPVTARVEFNAAQVRAALARAIREGAKAAPVTARVEFDSGQVRAALARAMREAEVGARANAKINVEADTGRFQAETEAARRIQESRPVKLNVSANLTSLGRAFSAVGGILTSLSLFPAIASGILVAAGALTNLAGGLFAVTSAASQAVGVLAVLPGLAAAAVQGLGALVLGFSGIGKAVQGMARADQQAATTAGQSARAQTGAADQIRSARQRLADAREAAAERVADAERAAAERIAAAQEQMARRVTNAERSLSDAQRNQRLAQQDLTKAREEAREELQQLAFTLREANLSEEQAQINLEHATLRAMQARQSAVMTPLEKRQAELDLKKAQLDLEEARDKAKDLAKEDKKASKEGVEGSDRVKRAKEALRDANRDLADAERELNDARKEGAKDLKRARQDSARELARARKDSARQIKDAQRALKQALSASRDQMGQTSAAVRNLNYAMDQLGPAGQRFARFIHDELAPKFRELRNAVQETLLPRLEKGIRAAFPLFKTLKSQFAQTGVVVGDLAIRFGKLAGSPAFRKDTKTIMTGNNVALKHFGGAAFYLAEALRHVMVVATPMVVKFSELVEKWAKSKAEAAKTGRETGRMAKFFDRAQKTAGKLKDIVDDLIGGLHNLGKAATPAGNTLLDSMARGAKAFNEWTSKPENQARLQKFFKDTVPVMRQFANLLGQIGVTFGKLAKATGGHTLDGLFGVLNAFLDVLNAIADMPGGGTILSTILLLAGAGLGLGLVAKFIGGILRNLGKLARLSGAQRVLGMLFGGKAGGRGGRRSQVGELADDVGKLTDNIDKELPKDKKKRDALDGVGGSAGKARKPAKGLGDDLLVMGGKAEKSAAKTGRFAKVIGGLKGVLGKAGKGVLGLGAAFLAIPGLGGLAAKLGNAIKSAFSKIKLPSLAKGIGGKGAAGAAAKGGLLTGFFGSLFGKFKLPGLGGIFTKVKGWFGALGAGIRKMVTGKALAKVAGTAAKSGAKGGAGGPLGIIGVILAGLLGSAIGGGKGGARGAAGGAISGGATGAGIGAMIGSIVPGLGTAIGAAVGALVGAIIGAITGGKYWSAIGTFFSDTLPHAIVDEAKRLPGQVVTLLAAGAGLANALNGWILKELGKFAVWAGGKLKSLGVTLGHLALKTLENLPTIIVDALFAIPELIASAVARMPDVFMWLVRQARNVVPKVLGALARLPGMALRAIAFGFSRAPQVWSWFQRQTESVMFHKIPNILWRAFTAFAKSFTIGLLKAVLRVNEHLKSITSKFSIAGTKWNTIWRKAGEAIYRFASSIFRRVANFIGSQFDRIRKTFNNAKTELNRINTSIWNGVTSGARKGLNAALSAVRGILRKISDAFGSAKDSIYRAWKPIGRLIAGPVNWIGQNVYQHGIKWVWDRVGKLVGKGGLPDYHAFRSGGVLPGYTPGRDVHRFHSPTGGTLDMSGGEAVMVPEWTRAVGFGRVLLWNKLARAGGPQAVIQAMLADFAGRKTFADGGVYGPYSKFDIGGLWDGIKGFGSALKGYFSDGLAKGASLVLDPILRAVAGAMGPGSFGDLLKSLPKTMVDAFLGWLTKTIEPKLGGDAKGVVEAAKSMVGQGDDRGPNNNWITRKWGMVGLPWCAMFVSEAISKAKAQKYYPGHPSAAVASYVGAMKHVGETEGRPGDLAAYRGTGHINIIERSTGPSGARPGNSYMTIGGNQNALIQRGVRSGMTSILRPKFSLGGIIARQAAQIFRNEAPRAADKHEMDTPLVRLMQQIPAGLIPKVTKALISNGLAVQQPKVYDTGGPVTPGSHWIINGHRRDEWMLTPQAVDLLGGERVVAALNSGAQNLYRAGRTIPGTVAASGATGRDRPNATVNVYPQQGQSEHEIGVIAARKLGVMVK